MTSDARATNDQIIVTAPFDGRELGRVPKFDADQVHGEVSIAHEAVATPHEPHARAAVLDRAVELLAQRHEEFAQCICSEAGKPITLARAEVDRALDTLRFSAVEARTLVGQVVPMSATTVGAVAAGFTLRVPVGVVAAITPFNFPLNLSLHKLAPAIAAGCPIVHKPASSTPLTGVLLHDLLIDAGLPPERLRLVTGSGGEVGDALATDPRVRHLSFTGSSDVGWQLPKRVHRARVSLELGNSTPLLVFGDADLDAVAAAVAAHGYGFAGQSCISVQRVLVEQSVYGEVLERLTAAVGGVAFGDPARDDVVAGPVIDAGARDKVLGLLREAEAAGARRLVGGDHDGNVIAPTLLADVDPALAVSCQELFGPAVVVTPFEDEAQAIEYANGTPYGLQAGAFTSDLTRALRLAERLEFGAVTINVSPTFRADQMPYGGTKDSGNTKEGPAWAVRELTEERLVLLGR
ncbi:MAG: aldehyde dehydrogenase family protein [Thermoleophilia bacterium]|nr:aldehyde dehydrogenase family protein [Thermoleophilia bacterium]